jgi:RNA polymerase sigma-70 factor (ECF subfamily)
LWGLTHRLGILTTTSSGLPLISRFREACLESNELLERLRRGDESAFDEIFRASYASLVRSAESLVRSRAVAEEIVQDVMFELWRRRDALERETSPQAYLFQSTRNRALNHLRHQRVEKRGEPYAAGRTEMEASGPAVLVEEEIDVALRDAVAALPDRCREIFELSRTQGLKYAEIASLLGISVKTVEAQMGKALRSLRERLAPWLPESRTL